MSDENDVLESTNTPSEVETDNTQEEVPSEKTQRENEPLTKEQKSKLAAFDRIYAENKSLKSKVANSSEKEETEFWQASKDPLEIVKLGKVLKDYDEQETEFIIKNAPSKDIDGIIKAEKDEMVQFAIKSRREKATKENKVPSPSGSSGGFSEKSAQEVEKLSRDDHKKYWKEQQERQASEGI
jgi:hypothetical protein